MRYFLIVILFFFSIIQTYAWIGIIPQNGDQITIAKWTEMANRVLSGVTQSGNTFGTKMIVGTNDNQHLALETNNTERITILSGGNVGISTTNPLAKLEVNSTVPNTSGLRFTQLSSISPVNTGAVMALGVSGSGDILTIPNGFPTILRTTATQANTSNFTYLNGNVLQIPVVPGKTYVFKSYIVYNAATAATGIRLRMNAPTNFWYRATVNATTTTSQYRSLFNDTTTALLSTSSIATTNNVAIVEGTIIPTTTGTGIIQFASETNGNAITIQPNSILYYYTY